MKGSAAAPTTRERLGRWDGTSFVPVDARSVSEPIVHVITHGWCPGLAQAVEATPGFLRVWDEAAVTAEGARFDRWFGPLAEAIIADEPEAAVLAYSWADESATRDSVVVSINSQRRTTVNGQRLATALRQVLSGEAQQLHLLGFSHGSKVATVAAALMDPPPRHLTTLDSPEGLLPVLGGAFNDLGSYMRILAWEDRPDVFIDNCVSRFGVQYGQSMGLGSVIDVVLDPEHHPLDEEEMDEHGYAWAWYLETARHPEHGVGFAWSPLRRSPPSPALSQLQQSPSGDGPFILEENLAVSAATGRAEIRERVRNRTDRTVVLATDGRTRARTMFWRRTGDTWASAPVRWLTGPDSAFVRVNVARIERARTVKGWSESADRLVHIPLSGGRPGPMLIEVELVSSEPAKVELRGAPSINGFVLPAGAELRGFARPVLLGMLLSLLGVVALLGVRAFGKLAHRVFGAVTELRRSKQSF